MSFSFFMWKLAEGLLVVKQERNTIIYFLSLRKRGNKGYEDFDIGNGNRKNEVEIIKQSSWI